MVGDFMVKKKNNIRKENSYLIEDQLYKNKMLGAKDNHNAMCHMCAKCFLDSNFNFK